ncbi:hypothetical protein DK926_03530 [Rhodococcus sp. Eu-32]|uniref:hypothetical protein n=1 Tax=Rhodococcus sp. Eu-32 TaxID=1017319 RepID=UPI000DF12C19|nr:hypothetical protein [Rhodococcus sp. Eu-32]RRQ28985.1 hypothetical protein DK926_03530 [Rhodococcus sp. Eu-32]
MSGSIDQSLAKAVEEIQILVSGDGARLDVIEPSHEKELRFALDLTEIGCADCLLPAPKLAEIATSSVRRHTGDSDYTVVIVDPREDA